MEVEREGGPVEVEEVDMDEVNGGIVGGNDAWEGRCGEGNGE